MAGKYIKASTTTEPAAYGNTSTMMNAALFSPIRVKSVSYPVDRGLLIEENIESPIPAFAFGGALKVSGTIEGNLRPKQMMPFWLSLFGPSVALVGTDPIATGWKFTLDAPSSMQLKIGENTSAATTDMELGYMGVGIKSANINVAAKEFVTARFDWFAKNYTAASPYSPPASGDYVTEDPVVFYNATINIGGTTVTKIKSMTINIDRKVDEERFVIGDFTLNELGTNGMTEVSGDITFTEKDYQDFKYALFGAASGMAANPIPLGCDNQIGGGSFLVMFTDIAACGSEVNKMYVKFTKINFATTDTTMTGQNEIEKKVTWKATGTAATGFELGVAT
jgi:hypothetical protein